MDQPSRFDRSWLWLALGMALAGLITAQPALVVLAMAVGTTVPLAWLWNRYALRRVVYERRWSETRAFVGETVTVTLSLTNRKPLPLAWVRVDDQFPNSLPLVDGALAPSSVPNRAFLVSLTSLGWYERVTWRHELFCAERGFFFFGPAELRASDMFGLFEQSATVEHRDRLIVYPRIEPLERLGLPAKDPFGVYRSLQRLFEDPSRVVGVREYHPDDPLRRVHWKATARTQQLQVRIWEPSEAHQLVILLNVATFERYWEGVDRELLEQTISVAASIASHSAEEKLIVGLLANAAVPQSDQPVRVMPSRSPFQMRAILEALAAVTSFPTLPIERLASSASSRLPWGATMVVVSAVVGEPLRATLLGLRAAGRRVALVSLDEHFTPEQGQELGGITVYHIPPRRRAGDRGAAGDGLSAGAAPDDSLFRPKGAER